MRANLKRKGGLKCHEKKLLKVITDNNKNEGFQVLDLRDLWAWTVDAVGALTSDLQPGVCVPPKYAETS
jgi:hypothetical protein